MTLSLEGNTWLRKITFSLTGFVIVGIWVLFFYCLNTYPLYSVLFVVLYAFYKYSQYQEVFKNRPAFHPDSRKIKLDASQVVTPNPNINVAGSPTNIANSPCLRLQMEQRSSDRTSRTNMLEDEVSDLPRSVFNELLIPFWHFLLSELFLGNHVRISYVVFRILSSMKSLFYRIFSIDPFPQKQVMRYLGYICLETSCCMFITKVADNIATFEISGYLFSTPKKSTSENCIIKLQVDLSTKLCISAILEESGVEHSKNMKDIMIQIIYFIVFAHHVQLHSTASFVRIDPETCDTYISKWLLFFTYTSEYFNFLGNNAKFVFSKEKNDLLQKTIKYSLDNVVPAKHSQVKKLYGHSRYVSFITDVRKVFMTEYDIHTHINNDHFDAEAYFTSTIVHSLDHYQFTKMSNVDLLFGSDWTEPMLAPVHLAFNLAGGCPLPYFHIPPFSWKRGLTSFHRNVYQYAKSRDLELADQMDMGLMR